MTDVSRILIVVALAPCLAVACGSEPNTTSEVGESPCPATFQCDLDGEAYSLELTSVGAGCRAGDSVFRPDGSIVTTNGSTGSWVGDRSFLFICLDSYCFPCTGAEPQPTPTVGYVCSGSTPSCQSRGTYNCYDGCYVWYSDYSDLSACTGQPTPCSSRLDSASCRSSLGCSWGPK